MCSDETILFLFKVSLLVIQQFDPDHEFTDADLSGKIDNKRIVADAEKAFVSLLKPQYNIVKFGSYPKGGGQPLRRRVPAVWLRHSGEHRIQYPSRPHEGCEETRLHFE